MFVKDDNAVRRLQSRLEVGVGIGRGLAAVPRTAGLATRLLAASARPVPRRSAQVPAGGRCFVFARHWSAVALPRPTPGCGPVRCLPVLNDTLDDDVRVGRRHSRCT
jgi:hypothetical protein